jgi:hypothetical protein
MNESEGGALPRTPADLLRAARDRVAQGWCQRAYAMDPAGHNCGERDPSAVSWCLVGALWASHADGDVLDALNFLRGACGLALSAWNDVPGRTQADVLAAIDLALAAAIEAETARSDSTPAPKNPNENHD